MYNNSTPKNINNGSWPYIYEVETTNACPYRCYMCPRGRGEMKRSVGFMSIELFKDVIQQISPEQKILRLHHFGEPVLHPNLSEFIELTRTAGLIPTLSLNPSSLNNDIIDKILDSGPGIVCFSLDSLDSERLYKIRGVKKSIDYCLTMIDYFIKKSRLLSNHVFKIIQMVSLTINRDEQIAFLSLKERYPENDVYIYISGNYGFGDIELIKETDEHGIEGIQSSDTICTAPFHDIVILWNGDVVLCCFDYDGFNIIGNIKSDTIEEIWDGEQVNKLRTIFNKRETYLLPLCKKCYLAPHNHPISHKHMMRGLSEESYILGLFEKSK